MYLVVDKEGFTTYLDDNAEEPARFPTEPAAVAFAESLAANNPGETFHVMVAISETHCDVSAPVTSKIQ